MNQYRYTVHDDVTFEGADSFNSDWDENRAEYIAEDAAAHYYSEVEVCWNSSDSISIKIFKEDGGNLGVFNVWYENSPSFCAY